MLPAAFMKASKPEPKRAPMACIRHSQGMTICGRDFYESKEFVFTDAAYAISNYSHSDCVRVCDACARAFKAKQNAGEASNVIRGMGDNVR